MVEAPGKHTVLCTGDADTHAPARMHSIRDQTKAGRPIRHDSRRLCSFQGYTETSRQIRHVQ